MLRLFSRGIDYLLAVVSDELFLFGIAHRLCLGDFREEEDL